MPNFQIRAVNTAGKRVVTVIDAANSRTVHDAIRERGWTVLSVSPVFGARWQQYRLKRLMHPAGIVLIQQLGELLRVGVPLSIALLELKKVAPAGPLCKAWSQVQHAVAGGESLTNALSSCHGILPPRYIAALSAAQSGGQLATSLLDISEELTWYSNTLQRWRQAASYPVFTLLVLLGVSGFLLLYVLPDLQPLLQPVRADLPWVTQHALLLSNAIHSDDELIFWLLGFFGMIIIFVFSGLLLLRRWHRLRSALLNIWLRCSFAQTWIWSFSVAAHARALQTLLKQNIPLSRAVHMAAPAAGIGGTQAVWQQVAKQVEHGDLLADAIGQAAVVPQLYVSLLQVGERRGTLLGSLAMASGLFQQRAEFRLQRIDTLIGPVLVLSVGALMVGVIVWVLLPAYDAVSRYGAIS